MKKRPLKKYEKDYLDRVMQGFQKLIELGYLVPVLDLDGQPVFRRGQQVYRRTDDPHVLAKIEGLSGNSRS